MEQRRRIVMFNRVSADGYFSGPDGRMDWVVPDDAIDKAGASSIPDFDTMLFGRRTYDAFESFWPKAIDGSGTALDPHGDRRTAALREMGIWINDARKLVFSRSRRDVTWNNSHLVRDVDPHAIEAMKNGPGKDIIIFGSGTIVSQLTEHGLIDEYQFVVTPILLGSGKSIVTNVPTRSKLRLLEATSQESGNVMLRYARGS